MEVICYVDVYWAWISTVMMIVKTATNSIYLVKVWIEYYHYCIHSCTLIFKHVSLNFSVVDCGFEIEAMDCSSCPQFENWCNSTDCGWIDGKCEGKQHLAHYFKSIYDSGPIVLYLGSCTNHVDNYGGQWNVHFTNKAYLVQMSTKGEGGKKSPKNGPHGLCMTPLLKIWKEPWIGKYRCLKIFWWKTTNKRFQFRIN